MQCFLQAIKGLTIIAGAGLNVPGMLPGAGRRVKPGVSQIAYGRMKASDSGCPLLRSRRLLSGRGGSIGVRPRKEYCVVGTILRGGSPSSTTTS
jgi:hypothetical protein